MKTIRHILSDASLQFRTDIGFPSVFFVYSPRQAFGNYTGHLEAVVEAGVCLSFSDGHIILPLLVPSVSFEIGYCESGLELLNLQKQLAQTFARGDNHNDFGSEAI